MRKTPKSQAAKSTTAATTHLLSSPAMEILPKQRERRYRVMIFDSVGRHLVALLKPPVSYREAQQLCDRLKFEILDSSDKLCSDIADEDVEQDGADLEISFEMVPRQ